jgi:hypothetical protein
VHRSDTTVMLSVRAAHITDNLPAGAASTLDCQMRVRVS